LTNFSDCKTPEEAKKKFRKLAKLYHPDKGGSNEKMAELKKEYESACKSLKGYDADFFDRHLGAGFTQTFNERMSKFKRQSTAPPPGAQYYNEMPYDHPIHAEIRALKYNINTLNQIITIKNLEISDLMKENERLRSKNC